MSLKDNKATRYVQDKMFPHVVKAVRKEEQCFTQYDLRESYLKGWDEALNSQWVRVEDGLPKINEQVFVLFEHNGKIMIDNDVYFGGDFYKTYYKDKIWSFGGDKIIAWMPIPSFDEILKANKDVLRRLKDK